ERGTRNSITRATLHSHPHSRNLRQGTKFNGSMRVTHFTEWPTMGMHLGIDRFGLHWRVSIFRREFVLLYSASARIVMKPLLFALCVVFAFDGLSEQKPAWQPAPGHTEIAIWPGAAPDPQRVAGPEYAETSGKDFLPGGRPAVGVSNVTRPTITVYSPQRENTGAAVVVFPGGGYQVLAIDLEGTEVCDWLTPKGITCVLLKYRVTDVGPYPKSGPYPESPMALEDAQRTVGLVRFHAAEWHINPHKIGVLG